jgi:ribosomal protein L37AE/L43A
MKTNNPRVISNLVLGSDKHVYKKCEECNCLHRHVRFSWGKWLCIRCTNKKILGKSDPKFQFEQSIIKKRFRMPYLSYGDRKYLTNRYYTI